ncbi:MAG: glutaredoxin 3 [Woeseia sp.]
MTEQVRIVMYGTPYCSYCMAARMLLKKKGVAFDEISVSGDTAMREQMEKLSGKRSVPQIFVGDQPVGGFDELYTLDQDGRLDELLGRQESP